MCRNLSSFSAFSKKHSDAFTVPSLRWLRFKEDTNGFAGAFVNVGRRVLVDEDRFFECVDRLRANEAWREIPVLIVTAKDITAEDRARLEGSVVRILEKRTLSQQELLAEVRNLVESRTGAFPQKA